MVRGTLLLVLVGTLRLYFHRPAHEVIPTEGMDVLPDLLAASTAAEKEAAERARPLGSDEKLDPNRASGVQLDRLPGVGPSLARSIVDYREREGAFDDPADLLSVRGLGPASLVRIENSLDFTVRAPPAMRRGLRGTRATVVPKVALNSASLEDLETLPGIGPAIAGRILELRAARGRFKSLDELLDVSGIGPKTLNRLRGGVELDGRGRY